ncbi:MAG: hypothetical protein MUF47_00305 [Porphyrobacter sp.]|nr:hypothetical protein [Porphyrobacter sp.]
METLPVLPMLPPNTLTPDITALRSVLPAGASTAGDPPVAKGTDFAEVLSASLTPQADLQGMPAALTAPALVPVVPDQTGTAEVGVAAPIALPKASPLPAVALRGGTVLPPVLPLAAPVGEKLPLGSDDTAPAAALPARSLDRAPDPATPSDPVRAVAPVRTGPASARPGARASDQADAIASAPVDASAASEMSMQTDQAAAVPAGAQATPSLSPSLTLPTASTELSPALTPIAALAPVPAATAPAAVPGPAVPVIGSGVAAPVIAPAPVADPATAAPFIAAPFIAKVLAEMTGGAPAPLLPVAPSVIAAGAGKSRAPGDPLPDPPVSSAPAPAPSPALASPSSAAAPVPVFASSPAMVSEAGAAQGAATQPGTGAVDFDSAAEQLATYREAARSARPELTLRHGEFGAVHVRLEASASAGDWRAILSSRDPAFVPAVQTALAASSTGEGTAQQGSHYGSRNADPRPSQLTVRRLQTTPLPSAQRPAGCSPDGIRLCGR